MPFFIHAMLACLLMAQVSSDREADELRGYCKRLEDGFYNHPSICEKYVQCKQHQPIVASCPYRHQFDASQKKCDRKENVTCLRLIGRTTFGAKGQQFGEVELTSENIGQPGQILQVKLERVHGKFKCSTRSLPTFWGCKRTIETIITDEKKNILFQQKQIPGYNVWSKAIVFNKMQSAPYIKQLPYKMGVWFNEDMTNHTEKDNIGKMEINVYVTMAQQKQNEDQESKVQKGIFNQTMQKQRTRVMEAKHYLSKFLHDQIQQIQQIELMQPQFNSFQIQQQNQIQLRQVLQQLQQNYGARLKAAIESLLGELQKRLPHKTRQAVHSLIQKQIKLMRQHLAQLSRRRQIPSQSGVRKQEGQLKRIIHQKIQRIQMQLVHQTSPQRGSLLRRQILSLRRQLQRIQLLKNTMPVSHQQRFYKFCQQRPNATLSHPSRCDRYVRCVEDRNPIVMKCPRNTLFDVVQKQCVPGVQAACLKRVGSITYKAGDPFGTVTLTKHNIGVPGKLIQVKLELRKQSQCATESPQSKRGCAVDVQQIVGSKITDEQSKVLFQHSEKMVQHECMIFKKQQQTAPQVPQLPYKFRVWFNNQRQPTPGQHLTLDVFAAVVQEPKSEGVEGFCQNKPNGNYNHPSMCEKFVTCSNSIAYVMDCPDGLHFDLATNECVQPSQTTCLKLIGTVKYGTRDNSFGKLVLKGDVVGSAGYLTQIKLEHVNGFVKCSSRSSPSRWGCNNEPDSYTREIIGTIVTDDRNNELFRQSRIPGYDGMSDFIIFNNQQPTAPHVSSLPYTLRIWYNEDLDDNSEEDNEGKHEINVYVTIVPHLPTRSRMQSEDAELEGYCVGKVNGNYHHPSKCEKYVECLNEIPYEMSCPSFFQFHATKKYCDYPQNALCLTYIGSASYGAKDNQYGVVTLNTSNLPKTGRLIQIKLEHVNGFLKCSSNSLGSHWGCNNDGTYTSEEIGTLVSDDQNNAVMRQHKIPGYKGMSPYIIFNKDVQDATLVSSLPFELRIWYTEDFTHVTEYDNSGHHSINVYATIAEEY